MIKAHRVPHIMNMAHVGRLAIIAATAVISSCASDPSAGYSFAASHDAAIGPIAVTMFNNRTFSHGLEVELTEALVKEIARSTPWAVAPKASAGAVLTGAITNVRIRPLATARTSGLTQEAALEVTVEFSLRDARTGRVILSKRNFRSNGGFIPVQGVGERIDIAQAGAVDALARDIVAALRSDW